MCFIDDAKGWLYFEKYMGSVALSYKEGYDTSKGVVVDNEARALCVWKSHIGGISYRCTDLRRGSSQQKEHLH